MMTMTMTMTGSDISLSGLQCEAVAAASGLGNPADGSDGPRGDVGLKQGGRKAKKGSYLGHISDPDFMMALKASLMASHVPQRICFFLFATRP
jgi:hypothetical protein